MSLELPIILRLGTEAEHTAADGNYMSGESSFTTDGKRLRIGDTGGDGIAQGARSTQALTVDPAAGGYAATEALVLASGYRRHVKTVSVAAHSGSYTKKITLPAQEDGAVAVLAGDEIEMIVTTPASANPTIEIYNESTGGTLLATITDAAAVAHVWALRFARVGAAWIKTGFAEIL